MTTSQDALNETAKNGFNEAANKFKLAKSWKKASEALIKSAALAIKIRDLHEAGATYVTAGSYLFKINEDDAGIQAMQHAVRIYQDNGKLDKAGKIERQIAEKCEAKGLMDEAEKHFSLAYDRFSTEDNFMFNAIGCMEKVATIQARELKYAKALKSFEKVIDMTAEDSRQISRMQKAIMNAFYCVLPAKDSVLTMKKTEEWADRCVRFSKSREHDFCKELNAAYEDEDADGIAGAYRGWERFHKLEDWQLSAIMVIFKEVKGPVQAKPANTTSPPRRAPVILPDVTVKAAPKAPASVTVPAAAPVPPSNDGNGASDATTVPPVAPGGWGTMEAAVGDDDSSDEGDDSVL